MNNDLLTQHLKERKQDEILKKFVMQSYLIEGIHLVAKSELEREVKLHKELFEKLDIALDKKSRTIAFNALCNFTKNAYLVERDGILRNKKGMDVRVGDFYPPKGGKEIKIKLLELLEKVLTETHTNRAVYETHRKFENLHPFYDGNGRSGRALAYWMTQDKEIFDVPFSFLHRWYYWSLQYANNYQRHGMCDTPQYRSWYGMKTLCNNKNHSRWDRYGGRGITYHSDFETFAGWWEYVEPFWMEAEKKHKGKRLVLSRLNIDGNYTYGNIQITTKSEKAKQVIQAHGVPRPRKPVIATCKKTGKEYHFQSGHEAFLQGYASQSHISKVCNGVGSFKSAGGYYWRFA